MPSRKTLMWLLLVVLILGPLTGAPLIGTVELMIWIALIIAWLVVYFRWARPHRV